MNWTWFKKMFPYFVMIIWTTGITFFVLRNTNIVNNFSADRTKAICNANNQLKAIVNVIIVKHSELGVEAERLIWVDLRKQLSTQLVPADCDNPKPLARTGVKQ